MTDSPAHPKHVFKDGHVLVVYASNHGHTAKIAARLAETMRGHGLEVDLRDVASAAGAQPGRYELAVIAASVHRQQHQKEIFDWVAARYEALTEMRSVFISVSLTAAEDTTRAERGRRAASTTSPPERDGRRPAPSRSRAACSTASTTSSRASSCACS